MSLLILVLVLLVLVLVLSLLVWFRITGVVAVDGVLDADVGVVGAAVVVVVLSVLGVGGVVFWWCGVVLA